MEIAGSSQYRASSEWIRKHSEERKEKPEEKLDEDACLSEFSESAYDKAVAMGSEIDRDTASRLRFLEVNMSGRSKDASYKNVGNAFFMLVYAMAGQDPGDDVRKTADRMNESSIRYFLSKVRAFNGASGNCAYIRS